nr:hypothetical protein [Prauserella cavernicola]
MKLSDAETTSDAQLATLMPTWVSRDPDGERSTSVLPIRRSSSASRMLAEGWERRTSLAARLMLDQRPIMTNNFRDTMSKGTAPSVIAADYDPIGREV